MIISTMTQSWPFVLLSAAISTLFVGGFAFIVGSLAYSRVVKNKAELKSIKIASYIQHNHSAINSENISVEEKKRIIEYLLEVESMNGSTFEYWSDDIDETPDWWKWAVSPEQFKQGVEQHSPKTPILPITTESHRNWRVVGSVLLVVGFVIFSFTGVSSYQIPINVALFGMIIGLFYTPKLINASAAQI